jgi:hypothetical protein
MRMTKAKRNSPSTISTSAERSRLHAAVIAGIGDYIMQWAVGSGQWAVLQSRQAFRGVPGLMPVEWPCREVVTIGALEKK